MRILLIDDDEQVLNSLSGALRLNGFPNRAFSSANDAIEFLKDEVFDVVITDCKMPDTDCYEVVKTIKDIDPSVAVFMMTGYIDEFTQEKTETSGADGFFKKPLDIQKLLHRIESIAFHRQGIE